MEKLLNDLLEEVDFMVEHWGDWDVFNDNEYETIVQEYKNKIKELKENKNEL